MADVKWIKITTDMFDNRKIKHLRKLPDGNNIVLIWVMLLTMAGRCNAGGMIFLTENIPYTPKMLADELDFEENTVRLALEALEQYNMIRRDGFLTISGWNEYQNVDGMERVREQTRARVAKYRNSQKLLDCNVTGNATVTHCNGTEEDIEKEKELEIENNPPFPPFADEISEIEIPFVGELKEAFVDWLSYKNERRESYKPSGLRNLVTQVKKKAEKYGDDAVVDVIRNSMASGYKGITFDRLEKQNAGRVGGTNTQTRKAAHEYTGRDFFDDD